MNWLCYDFGGNACLSAIRTRIPAALCCLPGCSFRYFTTTSLSCSAVTFSEIATGDLDFRAAANHTSPSLIPSMYPKQKFSSLLPVGLVQRRRRSCSFKPESTIRSSPTSEAGEIRLKNSSPMQSKLFVYLIASPCGSSLRSNSQLPISPFIRPYPDSRQRITSE